MESRIRLNEIAKTPLEIIGVGTLLLTASPTSGREFHELLIPLPRRLKSGRDQTETYLTTSRDGCLKRSRCCGGGHVDWMDLRLRAECEKASTSRFTRESTKGDSPEVDIPRRSVEDETDDLGVH